MSHLCVVDIDRDGFDDFYVMPSDSLALFFRNRGDGTFEEIGCRLGLARYQVNGAFFADFDNDGDSDVFLSFFPRETRYLENERGRFVERRPLGKDELPSLVIAMGAVDFNYDGLLDLHLSRYNGAFVDAQAAGFERQREAGEPVEPRFPGMEKGEARDLYRLLFSESADPIIHRPGPPNVLLQNLGEGRFARASGYDALQLYYQTMSATWSDIDLDGDMDLYVVNEGGPNQLIRNDGHGMFEDITDEVTSDVGFGMGLGWGDYDNDGRPDFYVTNMYSKAGIRIATQLQADERIVRSARGNSLFRNGAQGFRRVSGTGPEDIHVEAADFGWGGAFADLNNDGYLDLYAPAGYLTMPREVARPGDS